LRSFSRGSELARMGIKAGYAMGCQTMSSCSKELVAGGKRLPTRLYCKSGEGGEEDGDDENEDDGIEDDGVSVEA
jgi:hypothetical protein